MAPAARPGAGTGGGCGRAGAAGRTGGAVQEQVEDPVATMTTIQPSYPAAGADSATARRVYIVHSPVDKVFRLVARGGGTLVLLIMGLVGAFLTINALKAIRSVGVVDFITTQEWSPETNHFGI